MKLTKTQKSFTVSESTVIPGKYLVRGFGRRAIEVRLLAPQTKKSNDAESVPVVCREDVEIAAKYAHQHKLKRITLECFPYTYLLYRIGHKGITSLTKGWRQIVSVKFYPIRTRPVLAEDVVVQPMFKEFEGIPKGKMNVIISKTRPDVRGF